MMRPRNTLLAALLLAAFVPTDAAAQDPAPAAAPPASEGSPSSSAYLEARRQAKAARKREAGEPAGTFDRAGCMTDPKRCTCQSGSAAESSACGDILGYFCPDSTQRLLMAQCVDLFGGATMCKCANKDEIQAQVAREDAAAAAAAKAAEAKSKKKGGKKASK